MSNSMFKNIMRGGQLFLHNLRMMGQIVFRLTLLCSLIFIITTCGWLYLQLNHQEIYFFMKWLIAKTALWFGLDGKQAVLLETGKQVNLSHHELLLSPTMQNILAAVREATMQIIRYTGILCASIFLIILYYFSQFGRRQTKDKKIRGDDRVTAKELNKRIKNRSAFTLGNIHLPNNFETRHLLIHGTTGAGKSVCIRELLRQIRARGERVILYDRGGDYIRHFYQPNHDVILNPYDARGAPWHLWNECRERTDYDMLATALIPEQAGNANDPFWVNAARTLFAVATRQFGLIEERNMDLLLETLFHTDYEILAGLYRHTEAESLLAPKMEKTVASIKSVLSMYTKSLYTLKDNRDGFCIKDWVGDDSQKNWLFISSVADKHETLKPLVSMWLDIAANALLSLTPNPNRRIWMIFDELASLHSLPYLSQSFAEARKFGGCLVIGLQSIAQLKKIYGAHGADEITSLCNTRLFFRDPAYETAEWASKELGMLEVEETREGYSYSESAMRTGVNLSTQLQQKRLVSASEIMQLADLQAYVRLAGDYPIAKVNLAYREMPMIAPAFLPPALVSSQTVPHFAIVPQQ